MFIITIILVVIIVFLLIFLIKDRFSNLDKFQKVSYYGLMGRCPTITPHHQKKQNNSSINKNDIIKMYNNLSFSVNNDEELPNGGLLISMFDTNYACNGKSDYKTIIINNSEKNKCLSVNSCEGFDFKDIQKIMNKNTISNGTSCYALDTSYMRADFPSVLFGPLIGHDIEPIDMNIGIILDINLLKKYSACMSIVDSASIGRYNRFLDKKINTNNKGYIPGIMSGNIEPSDITDKEITGEYNNLLNSKKGRQLAQAGCGLQSNFQGPNLAGIYNDKILPNGNPNTYIGADKVILDKYTDDNDPFFNKGEKIIKASWGITQPPIRRTSWKYFIESLHKKLNVIMNFGNNHKLWKSIVKRYNSGDFVNLYTENEVDIFVPNKPLTDGGKDCEPTDEFKEIWKKAVIGIFTNNRCLSDINYNKLCDNCGKLQSYDCGGKDTCCCNKKFNVELVKKLVLKFNQNSDNIINGYIMNDNLNPSKDYPEKNSNTGLYDLQIEQITNY